MIKRMDEQLDAFSAKNKEICFSLGTLVVMGLSVIAMLVATFTLLKLPNPHGLFMFFQAPLNFIQQKLYIPYGVDYIPQIPLLLFICIILGRKYTMITVILYILMGLFLPIFASGGGWTYVLQYNFGYILAYLPAVWFATYFFKKGRNLLTCFLAVVVAVFTIHITGAIYSTIIAMAKHDTFSFAWGLIVHQSYGKIIYDITLGYISVMLARPSKQILWMAMG